MPSQHSALMPQVRDESDAEPTHAPLPALVPAVLASSSDMYCCVAIGGSDMTWQCFAALQWRRPVSAALHFRIQEGEGVERATLADAP